MSETSIYSAVNCFLEAAGFQVNGEVAGCDVVAVRDGEPPQLTMVEMKLGLNLELLLQAVDRARAADEVWLAVPASRRRGRDRDRRVHRLCRLIGFGLMALDASRDRVDVLAELGPYRPQPDARPRVRLLGEQARRVGDPSPGGSTRQPVMTVYRQRALACAAQLHSGPGRPRDFGRSRPMPARSCGAMCMAGSSAAGRACTDSPTSARRHCSAGPPRHPSDMASRRGPRGEGG